MLSTLLTLSVATAMMFDQHRIEIESDSVIHNIYEHRSEWIGDVIVTEGSYTLNARVLVVELNEAGQPCKIRAVGEPLEALGPRAGGEVSVSGEVLLYDCEQNKVRVARNATIRDSATGATSSADNIIYNLITREMTATSSPSKQSQLRLSPRGL